MHNIVSSRLWRVWGAALVCGLLSAQPAPAWAVKAVPKAAGAAPEAVPAEPAAQKDEQVININTAGASELQLLPGIGERKALAIVARRDKKKFTRPEELMDVKGIGRGIFKKLKPYVRVQGPTTLMAKVGGAKKREG